MVTRGSLLPHAVNSNFALVSPDVCRADAEPQPRALANLVVKNGSKTWGKTRAECHTGVTHTNFDAMGCGQRAGGNRDQSAVRRRFRRIDQQIHQHLRKLIGIHHNVRQVFRNPVLRPFVAQRRLAFEKAERVGHQAMQAEVASAPVAQGARS